MTNVGRRGRRLVCAWTLGVFVVATCCAWDFGRELQIGTECEGRQLLRCKARGQCYRAALIGAWALGHMKRDAVFPYRRGLGVSALAREAADCVTLCPAGWWEVPVRADCGGSCRPASNAASVQHGTASALEGHPNRRSTPPPAPTLTRPPQPSTGQAAAAGPGHSPGPCAAPEKAAARAPPPAPTPTPTRSRCRRRRRRRGALHLRLCPRRPASLLDPRRRRPRAPHRRQVHLP